MSYILNVFDCIQRTYRRCRVFSIFSTERLNMLNGDVNVGYFTKIDFSPENIENTIRLLHSRKVKRIILINSVTRSTATQTDMAIQPTTIFQERAQQTEVISRPTATQTDIAIQPTIIFQERAQQTEVISQSTATQTEERNGTENNLATQTATNTDQEIYQCLILRNLVTFLQNACYMLNRLMTRHRLHRYIPGIFTIVFVLDIKIDLENILN